MKTIMYGILDPATKDLVMIPDNKGYLKSMTEDIAYLRKLCSDNNIVTITLESFQEQKSHEQCHAAPA